MIQRRKLLPDDPVPNLFWLGRKNPKRLEAEQQFFALSDDLTFELIDSDGVADFQGALDYSLTYQVFRDSAVLGPNTAMNAVDWTWGDYYYNELEDDYDDRSRAVRISCDKANAEDKFTRIVTVDFSRITPEMIQLAENPFSVFKESFKANQEGELPLDRDANGQAVRNRAGDKIAEGVTAPVYRGVYKCTKNFAQVPLYLLYYLNAVNGDNFGIFPAKTLRMIDIDEIEAQYSPDYGVYYPITLYFSFNPDGHKKFVLNEGYRALNDEGKLEHIMVNGEKTTEPMLLTMGGKMAPEGAPPTWLEFETAFTLPFGGILG